jgi:hypothetical protein
MKFREASFKDRPGRTTTKGHSFGVAENFAKYDRRSNQKCEILEWECCEEREFPIKSLEVMIVVSWNCRGLGSVP